MDTYEKKYKESLALMVDCIPDEDGYVHVRPQDIFPELKGSGDEKIRKTLIDFFQDWRKNRSHCWGISVPEILTWLEKQGTSYTKKDVDDAFVEGMAFAKNELEKQSEQKPAWSEEDEVKINRIVACLENLNVADNDILLKDVDWLKSLKERYIWKPSDDQMRALEYIINNASNTSYSCKIAKGLLEQLKKLKGE